MSQLKPFRAHRPRPQLAAQVAAVPYDVVNTQEAAELAKGNPHSFLHVGRPEIDLPAGTDTHADEVYAKGVANLRALIQNGTLFHENTPCLYVYQQRMGDHVQAGMVGLCSVVEYETGAIKRHEFTRKDKEDDRTRHVTEQAANAEPVFLTYKAVPYIDHIVNDIRKQLPVYDVVTPDGIGHTVWVVSGETVVYELVNLFNGVPALYIADGHHRTAAAIRYAQTRRAEAQAKGVALTGDEPFESFMAVVFPHDQLKIMDYNRVVKDLNGLSQEAFLTKVKEKFDVTVSSHRAPQAPTTFGMYLGGTWYELKAKPGSFPAPDPVRGSSMPRIGLSRFSCRMLTSRPRTGSLAGKEPGLAFSSYQVLPRYIPKVVGPWGLRWVVGVASNFSLTLARKASGVSPFRSFTTRL